MLGYHVRAGAASEVPANEVGFVVTANGLGGYRVAWVAVDGNVSTFAVTIDNDATFDPISTAGFSGRETITMTSDSREITASSVPGSQPDGVDFVPAVDPIYVSATIDGVPGNIYFTGADTGHLLVTHQLPVAFTSP